MSKSTLSHVLRDATPITGQQAPETQPFGSLISMPIALDRETRSESQTNLNQLLADVMTLRDLYKKHHWQVSGPTFYQLHLLFDKHFDELNDLVDLIGERIMMLGGVSIAMAADVAETTMIPRPPAGTRGSVRPDLATAPCSRNRAGRNPARWPGWQLNTAMTGRTICSSAT